MDIMRYVLEFLLLIWFFGCIKTYRIGTRTLVEGMGIHSAEFIMLVIYSIGIVVSLFVAYVGQWILLIVLSAWFIIQFFCHWYFTIFGASKTKIEGYNKCFRNTIHIIPLNEHRIIPDLYHIVLHMLILLNIVLAALSLTYAK
ncbi:MAG: hypothetical protein PHX51_04315 [Clostridia bacterium]|nr:hypothetical protein [Clostridia bacterium]